MGHAKNKTEKLLEAKKLYLLHADGITDIELSKLLNVDRASAYRYRTELKTSMVSDGKYTLVPSGDDVELANAVIKRNDNK